MEEESDAVVIARSWAQPVLFGAIFDRHASVLHRYFVRRLGPAEAESLVGEVFRIAFEKRGQFDTEQASSRPWLYGIANHLVAKHHRREARRVRAVGRLAAERSVGVDVAEGVSGAVDAAARWPRIADAITALPAAERDALVLLAWEGLSYDEIAAAQAVPVGTVRSRLNRARRRLRELDVASGGEAVVTVTDGDPGRMGP
jgi:RNA polymerase sigma-70 factor (ECF subfamily)